jgi:YebC/PmpR family DNA-binding regulatory protein
MGGNIISMSGHSKWSTIKRDKAVTDAKRGQEFTKIIRLITVAARQGGGDPSANATLRLAIEKAKSARMPKDNIDRAIKKGTGGGGAGSLEEVTYEGFGPNGEAFMVEAITDNKNRTVAEIRGIFNKVGGSLGGVGCTSYIFSPDPLKPSFKVTPETPEQEKKLRGFLEQLETQGDAQKVYTNVDLEK